MPAQPTGNVPDAVRDATRGFSLLAGGANVVMQLSRLPVGRGVAESRVDSGRVDRHPIKRLRTTTAYLMIALYGTDDERLALRKQIDAVHAQVRSRPDDAVAYNAFDTDLQLWVAACLYVGLEDLHERIEGTLDPSFVDEVLYPWGQRLGTTLQVKPEHWPADRAAFEEYWQQGVASIEMDGVTRAYLRGVVELAFVVGPLGPFAGPLRRLLAPSGRLMNLGFLPQAFRDELGMTWSDAQQRRFDRIVDGLVRGTARMPRWMREFPLNLYLADTRRRLRTGRLVI